MIYDAAVIIPTILRGQLLRAVRSVFEQDFQGTIQIMLGIDHAEGNREMIDELKAECPENRTITVLDLGYSTSSRRGGFYQNWSGGALRTLLSYAANSRYLAYLDDDNWWAPEHISSLMEAIDGADWAFSHRWYVDPATQKPLFIDEWESVGPDKGMYAEKTNGFVDTNCLMIDKEKCHWDLPAWCVAVNKKGSGVDRVIFERLRRHDQFGSTGKATAFYVFRSADTKLILKLGERRIDTTHPPQSQPSMSFGADRVPKPRVEDTPADLDRRLEKLEGTVSTLTTEFRNLARTTLPQMMLQVTQQSETLDILLSELQVDRGWLPPTRGWAGSPDFLLLLVKHILKEKPENIVECGSGVSSLVVGRCLELMGKGTLHSLEHKGSAAEETRLNLEDRNLKDQVTVVLAPFKSYTFHGRDFRWYDIKDLPKHEIDCLIVDGPPLDTGAIARYPAAPMLFDRMAPGGAVFLDDYHRKSERQSVQAWLRQFPNWTAVAKQTEKGCAMLRKPT